METQASPHSSAVSGLMQQLKSGEISKMQLFQQIAKLQAASAATSAVAPSLAATMTPSTMLSAAPAAPLFASATAAFYPTAQGTRAFTVPEQISAFTQQPQPFSSFAFTAPSAVAPFLSQSSSQQQPHLSMLMNSISTPQVSSFASRSLTFTQRQVADPTSRASFPSSSQHHTTGATKLDGDPEFLASGVSHDKAQRFSVQEWMASKNRSNSAPTCVPDESVSAATWKLPALRGDAVHTTLMAQLFPQPLQPHHNDESSSDSSGIASQIRLLNLHRGDEKQVSASASEDSRYEYNPQRQFDEHQDNAYGHDNPVGADSSNKQEYIDFAEHFRDDLNEKGGNNSNVDGANGKGNNGPNNVALSSGNDDAKFHARSELDECTFAPKVNPKSTKVAAKLWCRQGSKETMIPSAVSERLYQEADNYKAREELAQRLKAEEEAELERECTFKPRINCSNCLTEKVKAKYMDTQKSASPSLTAAAMESTAKELEQCTFYPKVNPIGPEMVSAQLYLQQDIYERLSRPCCMVNDSPMKTRRRGRSTAVDDDAADTDSEVASLVLTSPGGRRRSQDDMYIRSLSPGNRRRSSATNTSGKRSSRRHQRPRSAGGIHTDEEKEERARQLDNFLERQHFHEEARRKKIETTKQQLQPAHKPTINKKSLNMMENGRKGDFLERITKYALRKEHGNVKRKSVRVATSTKRKARSVTELSRGDLLRRETTQRLMKLKMEQEEMAALTFRPQLNRVSERHEGKLKILTSPDTYLQRIQQQSQAHTIKQRRAMQEKEMEEFAECTFKPRTIEVPAYIQRIARSVSLTKPLKQQQQMAARAGEKPEWK
ncbi:hypothetical protein FI667_g10040, partial [Globisporangium splendens]